MREWHKTCRVFVVDGKKPCTKCHRVLSVEEFHKCTKTLSGLQPHCKTCRADYQWKNYGITREKADKLLASQGGVCGACQKPNKLHVDHDHKSGKVRGFLCGPCNRALGMLQDDPQVIKGLLRYLTNSR